MTFEERMLAGILIAITTWMITKLVSHFSYRHRLQVGIVSELNHLVSEVDEAIEYLDKCFENSIRDGVIIKYTAYHP